MARKKGTAKKRDPKAVTIQRLAGEDDGHAMGRFVMRPTVQAASTIRAYGQDIGGLEIEGLIAALTAQTAATNAGDFGRAEAMLAAQAHTLDAIFNTLARRAALNMGEYMGACETYLKLALRAQAQSRATWEAVSAIKNPPLAGYVGQANIAGGHQQVNNGPRAGETENSQSKLLEQTDGERLDTGTAGAAGGVDPGLEAVGAVDRAEDGGG